MKRGRMKGSKCLEIKAELKMKLKNIMMAG